MAPMPLSLSFAARVTFTDDRYHPDRPRMPSAVICTTGAEESIRKDAVLIDSELPAASVE